MPVTRVMIVEDSTLLRDGLVRLITDGGMEVVDARGDAVGLLDAVEAELPDVVLMDVRMPPSHTTEGLEAAIAIRGAFPQVGVLVLSQYLEPTYAVQLLENTPNGVGYLLKDRITNSAHLLESIGRIADGESVIDSEVVDRLLNKRRKASAIDSLSDKERDVLRLMASGYSNTDIARSMFVTLKTVESHTRNMFGKLGLLDQSGHRRVLAVLEWLRAN